MTKRFQAVDAAGVGSEFSCLACGYEWRGERAVCPRCRVPTIPADADQVQLFAPPEPVVPDGQFRPSPASREPRSDQESEVAAESLDPAPAATTSQESRPEQFGFDVEQPKPPYRVPPMNEIRATPPNGLTHVSTFSGCGGSCLGFEWAGFQTLFASEFIPAAAETYEANFPDSMLDTRDIRQLTPEFILGATGLGVGELDVFEGSPPCASFSMAGKRDAHWGEVKKYSDTEQRTDDLFDEFVRILRGLQPRAFVAENVAGLVSGVAVGYFKEIMGQLEESGYRVGAQVLDAQWLGVPQRRKRLIFVGFRKDTGLHPVFPEPFAYRYSIRDALPWLGGVRHELGASSSAYGGVGGKDQDLDAPVPSIITSSQFDVTDSRIVVDQTTSTHSDKGVFEHSLDDQIPTITANGISSDWKGDWMIEEPTEAELAEVDITRFAIGREWDNLAPGESSDKYLNLIKPDADEPSPTVTQTGGNLGAASVTHPTEKRKFTIPELRRLSGFPDDFALTGSWGQQWERIGRAVPPPMMRAVAARVAEELKSAK